MTMIAKAYLAMHDFLFGIAKYFAGIAPLLIRLYLAPVMIAAGLHKLNNQADMVEWFGNKEWGLGLDNAELMVQLATWSELAGGVLILIGFATRWAAVPLMVTMVVAALTVHLDNGWFAIAPSDPASSTAKPLADLGIPQAQASLENSVEVGQRLDRARSILQEHGNYQWLTETGTYVVLNNGIEFAATYFILLLSLFFTGAGWLSMDGLLGWHFRRKLRATTAAAAVSSAE